MSRKGENIYRRKDGRWEGRYIRTRSTEGKVKYGYVYGKTYGETRDKLAAEKAILRGNISEIDEKTFDYFAGSWIESIVMQVKESTYAKYTNILNNHLKPSFGKYKITEINTELVRGIVEKKMTNGNLRTGQRLSPKTMKDIVSVMGLILKYAQTQGATVNCKTENITIRSCKSRKKSLTKAEQIQLTEYLLQNINPINIGILLALYTGLRIGELCALKFEDVSVTEKILNINKTMQRLQKFSGTENKTEVVITSPKSESSQREIPLPDFLVEILACSEYLPNAYLLTGDSNRYIEPRTMENKFKKCLKTCGLEEVTFHQLRHRFATYCVELGFEIKSLSEILGHSSVNITLNRYVHSSMELKRNNMAKLEANFSYLPSEN